MTEFSYQSARFLVFTAPATDEILELHFVRVMVFAGPASDSIFESKIARFVVSTEPATDKILRLHFVRLMVFAGPASDRIFVPECQVCGFYCACHGRNFEASFCKAHGLCWACQ